MNPKLRSLLMRSNRLLGAQLVEHNLIQIDDLEAANEKLLEIINSGSPRQRTVLGILAYDLKAVQEETVLTHLAEQEHVGLVDLRHYEGDEDLKARIDVESCWVTWSAPFDTVEDVTCVATAYYLSPAVRKYWEEQYDGRVLWYATTLEQIADHLEKLEEAIAAAAPAEPKLVANDPEPLPTPPVDKPN